jgi:hypothetical protein
MSYQPLPGEIDDWLAGMLADAEANNYGYRSDMIQAAQAELTSLRQENENLTGLLEQSNTTMASQRKQLEPLTWSDDAPVKEGDYKIDYCGQVAYGKLRDGMFHLYRGPHSQMAVSVSACRRWAGPIPTPAEPNEE